MNPFDKYDIPQSVKDSLHRAGGIPTERFDRLTRSMSGWDWQEADVFQFFGHKDKVLGRIRYNPSEMESVEGLYDFAHEVGHGMGYAKRPFMAGNTNIVYDKFDKLGMDPGSSFKIYEENIAWKKGALWLESAGIDTRKLSGEQSAARFHNEWESSVASHGGDREWLNEQIVQHSNARPEISPVRRASTEGTRLGGNLGKYMDDAAKLMRRIK